MDVINQLTFKQLKIQLEQNAGQTWEPFPGAPLSAALQQYRSKYPQVWDRLLTEGERLMDEPIPALVYSDFIRFAIDGDRKVYDRKYASRRRRLTVFALLYMETMDKRWLRALEDVIWVICDEFTWVIPAHVGLYVNEYPDHIWDQPEPPRETIDLCAGDTAMVFAEIACLLRDDLSPWVLTRMRQETERRIFQVYYEDPRPQNWELKTNNWPSVCASAIGAAAIYWEQDGEKLAGMLWRIIEVLRRFLDGFDEQGATPEGISYWQYGFGMFVTFAELLKQRTNGAINLLEGTKVAAIANFPQACLLSNRKAVNFSDSTEEPILQQGLFAKLDEQFPDNSLPLAELVFNDLAEGWIWSIRDILWTSASAPDVSLGKNSRNEQHYYYPGHQWAITKVPVKDGLIAWAAKGGNNAEPHNHNDIGHFILHVNGSNVFMDIGAGIYTRQYFQPAYRYEQLAAGSHGHSVPIVNGIRQGSGEDFHAEIMSYSEEKGTVDYALDLTAAYPCEILSQLVRHFHWQTEQSHPDTYMLQIADTATFSQIPSSYEEVFILSEQPKELQPGVLAIGSHVILSFDSHGFSWQAEPHIHPVNKNGERIFWRLIFTWTQPASKLLAQFEIQVQYNIYS